MCSHPSFGSVWSGYSFTARSYLPDKLQIVKPLEGDYSSERHKSSDPPHIEKKSQNQTPPQKEKEHVESPQQSQKLSLAHNLNRFLQASQSPSPQNQQQDQYLCFQCSGQSQIFVRASEDPKGWQRSSSLSELSILRPPLVASRALVTGLLEVLDPQEGPLSLQHSFYFRHTQPRCWFEM